MEDAAMLTELAARTFYDAFAAANTPENMEAFMSKAFTVAQISDELADPHVAYLIADMAGQPAGFAKLYDGEPPDCVGTLPAIEISRFYVDQQFHGSGVAHVLMQACLDQARLAGKQTIYLGVWEHNPRAIAFYRKWEFEIAGTHAFQLGDDPQTDFWMTRSVVHKHSP